MTQGQGVGKEKGDLETSGLEGKSALTYSLSKAVSDRSAFLDFTLPICEMERCPM